MSCILSSVFLSPRDVNVQLLRQLAFLSWPESVRFPIFCDFRQPVIVQTCLHGLFILVS